MDHHITTQTSSAPEIVSCFTATFATSTKKSDVSSRTDVPSHSHSLLLRTFSAIVTDLLEPRPFDSFFSCSSYLQANSSYSFINANYSSSNLDLIMATAINFSGFLDS